MRRTSDVENWAVIVGMVIGLVLSIASVILTIWLMIAGIHYLNTH
jgi:hypothetical protein